jgi:hypothetical protein
MTDTMIGICGIGGMFILLAIRVPVGMAMLAAGFFGAWVLSGQRSAVAILSAEAFSAVSA